MVVIVIIVGKIELTKMKNTMKNHWQIVVSITIALIIISFLFGCGTRKTDTQQTENIVIQNQYDTGSKIVLGNTFTYRPFDNSKPMILDGKKYNNAIVSNDKSITKTRWKTKYINTTITKYRTKQTEKTDHTFLYIGLFLVLIIGVLGWFKFPSFRRGI